MRFAEIVQCFGPYGKRCGKLPAAFTVKALLRVCRRAFVCFLARKKERAASEGKGNACGPKEEGRSDALLASRTAMGSRQTVEREYPVCKA